MDIEGVWVGMDKNHIKPASPQSPPLQGDEEKSSFSFQIRILG